LAPLFVFGGDQPPVLAARVLGALLGTLAVAGVGWLAAMLFGPRAGLLAAAIAAIEPGIVATSVMVLSEAVFLPLMILHLALWVAAWFSPEPTATGMARYTRRRRWLRAKPWLAAGAGLAAGAATLARPVWLLFAPLAIVLAIAAGPQRKRHLEIGGVMLAGLVVAMLPWWIRNDCVIGRFVPTTLQVGASLYDGLNPQATGASDMAFVPRFVEEEQTRPAAGNDAGVPLEYRLDRQMKQAAIDWALDHPAAVLRLAAVKFVRIWNVWPNEKGLSTWPIRLALTVTYVPIMLLAALGAVRTIRRGWPYVLCWLPAVYFTLFHMIFVASIRYRMPAMLTLIVLAAGAVCGRDGKGEKGEGRREKGDERMRDEG
jgi:4-amino-4-deoxy-L-arabinose transferase-like glycosyltransferase